MKDPTDELERVLHRLFIKTMCIGASIIVMGAVLLYLAAVLIFVK